MSLPAHASRAVDEVAQLLDQGKADQAARQADAHLKQNPGDVEMRFMRGVIAIEAKQSAQAIKIFTSLTRDFPNMPEPYNNLAVLYAAEGQERKAAEALEQAIRTNPSYTTAHENLGDLYARMASEAYSKALQLDDSRQALRPKLALITQLVPGPQSPVKPLTEDVKVAAAPVPVSAAAPAARTKAEEVKPEPKPAPRVEAKAEPVPAPAPKVEPKQVVAAATPVAAPAPAPVPAPVPVPVPKAAPAPATAAAPVAVSSSAPVAKVAEAKPEPKPEPVVAAPPAAKPAADAAAEPKSAVHAAAAEVEAAVHAWALAWSKQDMPRYLDAYSDKFVPADGSNLARWKETRRLRIVGKNTITVTLRDVKTTVNGDQATVRFRQNYAGGNLNTTTMKTLTLHNDKGHWRITRETTGG